MFCHVFSFCSWYMKKLGKHCGTDFLRFLTMLYESFSSETRLTVYHRAPVWFDVRRIVKNLRKSVPQCFRNCFMYHEKIVIYNFFKTWSLYSVNSKWNYSYIASRPVLNQYDQDLTEIWIITKNSFFAICSYIMKKIVIYNVFKIWSSYSVKSEWNDNDIISGIL